MKCDRNVLIVYKKLNSFFVTRFGLFRTYNLLLITKKKRCQMSKLPLFEEKTIEKYNTFEENNTNFWHNNFKLKVMYHKTISDNHSSNAKQE